MEFLSRGPRQSPWNGALTSRCRPPPVPQRPHAPNSPETTTIFDCHSRTKCKWVDNSRTHRPLSLSTTVGTDVTEWPRSSPRPPHFVRWVVKPTFGWRHTAPNDVADRAVLVEKSHRFDRRRRRRCFPHAGFELFGIPPVR